MSWVSRQSLIAVMATFQFLFYVISVQSIPEINISVNYIHVMSVKSVPEISIAVNYIHVVSIETEINYCNG